MVTPDRTRVPDEHFVVHQLFDRRMYFYDIIGSQKVLTPQQRQEGVLLGPGESTDIIITRGDNHLHRTVTNTLGQPRFTTRRGWRDWQEQFRWWLG
ncbi:MAG: hypothetical protein WD603_00900 [Patescibacteria group bacterium]